MLQQADMDGILLTQCALEVKDANLAPQQLLIYVPQALKDGIRRRYEEMLLAKTGTITEKGLQIIERDIAMRERRVLTTLHGYFSAGKSDEERAHMHIRNIENNREADFAYLEAATDEELARFNQLIVDMMRGDDTLTFEQQQEIVARKRDEFPPMIQPALVITGAELIASIKQDHAELMKNAIYNH